MNKTERHTIRKGVRSTDTVTRYFLSTMPTQVERIARAEMRKRGFFYQNSSAAYYRRYGMDLLLSSWVDPRP